MGKLLIISRHYDYFGGDKTRRIVVDNLFDGWQKYRQLKAKEFTYDDAFYHINYMIVKSDPTPNKPQRPHARSLWEWEQIMARQEYDENRSFDETEMKYLISLAFEDIMI